METLAQIAARFPLTDKGTIHSYLEVYERLFERLRLKPITLLEIGVCSGDSLRMWDAYFPNGKVYGVDNDPTAYQDDRVKILDATSSFEVETKLGGMRFDIIIDDASHRIWDQIAIYRNLSPHLAKDGIYVIEDVADLATEPRIGQRENRDVYLQLDPTRRVELIDLRDIHNRFDDVLLVIRDFLYP
jgi:hypothetical protein